MSKSSAAILLLALTVFVSAQVSKSNLRTSRSFLPHVSLRFSFRLVLLHRSQKAAPRKKNFMCHLGSSCRGFRKIRCISSLISFQCPERVPASTITAMGRQESRAAWGIGPGATGLAESDVSISQYRILALNAMLFACSDALKMLNRPLMMRSSFRMDHPIYEYFRAKKICSTTVKAPIVLS